MGKSNNISRSSPAYMIAGTLFCYDEFLNEFTERDVPSNRISMKGVWEENLWTQFFFDHRTRNIYTGGFPDGKRPSHVHLVLMPSLPYCSRLGIHVKTYHEKQAENKREIVQVQHPLKQNQRKHKKGRRIS